MPPENIALLFVVFIIGAVAGIASAISKNQAVISIGRIIAFVCVAILLRVVLASAFPQP